MPAGRPNILFLLSDQHRPDWLGCNPELPLRTPNIDKLGNAGVRFTNAHTPSPLCAPARACLASGMEYDHCRVPGNHYDYPSDLPTYYQQLRDAGYRVGGVGKFDLHKSLGGGPASLDWHLDGSRGLAEWGFTEGIDNEGKIDGSSSYRAAGKPKGPYLKHLHDRELADIYVREHAQRRQHQDAYVTALPEESYCDNWLSENGLTFLRNFPAGQPWHLVVNFTGPHNPMDVTQRMHDEWEGVVFPPPVANTQADFAPADHQRNRRYYAAMIENIDRQVGRFIEEVSRRGELDHTLIVYASDHGEMLGDHSRWGKSTWQRPSVGIPLIVSGPGVSRVQVSDALVSLHDLAATFLDFAAAPPLPGMDARSMCPLLSGASATHRSHVTSALGDWRTVFDGRWKLVTRTDQPPMLFDLAADPWELNDVAAGNDEIIQRLAAVMATIRP